MEIKKKYYISNSLTLLRVSFTNYVNIKINYYSKMLKLCDGHYRVKIIKIINDFSVSS